MNVVPPDVAARMSSKPDDDPSRVRTGSPVTRFKFRPVFQALKEKTKERP